MRKYNKYIIAGLLLSLLSFSTYAATERDNNFCISGDWKEAHFTTISKSDTDLYSVTTGQPFSGIDLKSQPSDKKCIRVKAGRKNSTKVIRWARDNRNDDTSMYPFTARAIKETTPEEANFAIRGTLFLTDKNNETLSCQDVIIAQGSLASGANIYTATDNVWFMYTNTSENNIIQCITQDDTLKAFKLSPYSLKSGTHNHFKITSI